MSQDSSLAMVTGQIAEHIVPRVDEIPNPLRPQLGEDRDKIPTITTQQKTFVVTVGNDIQRQLGFAAAAVTIHNSTKYWWYLPDLNAYIPPNTMNLNINFELRPQTANIQFLAPVDFPQPDISDATSAAVFIYGDKPLSPTTVIVPAAGGGVGSDVTVVGPLDGSGNVKVAISSAVAIAGTVPVSGTFWQATQPVSGTVTALPSGTQVITGTVSISGTVPVSGTFWQATQPVSGTFWQATQPVSIASPITANPSIETPFTLVSAASTNATLIAAGARVLKTIQIINNNAAPIYLKIFNKATAPVPGTDTPVLNYEVPANGAGANLGAGFVIELNTSFNLGLGIAITAGQALTNATAVAAGDATLNMSYI